MVVRQPGLYCVVFVCLWCLCSLLVFFVEYVGFVLFVCLIVYALVLLECVCFFCVLSLFVRQPGLFCVDVLCLFVYGVSVRCCVC